MGLIKALVGAVGGGLADQWLEVLEADNMGQTTVFTSGVTVRAGDKRSSNTKGTEGVISDGSIIHVYDNQFMLLVDGGKVVDYTAEPGYYKVDNSSMPSLFNGQFGDALKETFSRIKYGGVPGVKQKAYFINLQEIKGIKFGTRNPINYFDTFYNSELFLRAHGTYSIKVTEPLKFYQEVVPRNAERVEIDEVNEQYLNEFLEALQAAINQMSADGGRISHVTSKARELSTYMSETLDVDWKQMRGMEVLAVGLGSISYDEESQKLINMRNQGAMLGDPSVREGYVQGAIARGMEAAGSNEGGAAQAFLGMGIGMNTTGGAAAAFSQSNQAQMQQQQAAAPVAGGWPCANCGAQNGAEAKFCSKCGTKKPEAAAGWTCANCNAANAAEAKFCSNCGNKKPEGAFCPNCGAAGAPGAKFCPECGQKL
ncbi:MAG: SPFH domain-containing protein [Candidatus Pelethousia sp.]|nr:SPFH domain-containing protein [Candidatus Pelethousia sp.]